MSDVTVTLGAESKLLLSEFQKVIAETNRLKKKVGDVGGVLEGDKRVEGKLTAWVDGFKNASNGADLLANTMGNLGDVFKTSLAIGVALNVGASLVGMFSSAITECDNLKKSAEATGAAIKDALASKDSGQISAMLKTANEEMAKLQERMKSWKPTLAPVEGMSANVFQGRVDLANELIVLMKQENEIQSLINQGFTEEAALLAEKYRLEKEIAAIRKQGFPTETQQGEAIRATEEASALRVEAIKNKAIQEEKSKRNKAADEKHAQVVAQAEKDIAAEQEAMEHFNEWKAEQEATALKQKQDDEAKALKLGMEAFGRHEDEKTRIAEEAEKKRLKAIEDADKLALEGKKEALKEQEDIVKKGEQEQKQRDDRAMQALQGGGGLQALQSQRLSDRQAEAARDKAAGIAARDEIRRKYGGDATKMTKEEIADVKARILGEKQLDKKKIEAAIAGIPKIEAEIAKLVAKLGVK
jgi:hypothetical protein